MSVFTRRKKLDVPDGEYRVIANIQGQPEQSYALRVEDGLPNLLFPVLIPNSLSTYHLLELKSKSLVQIHTGDAIPLFRLTEKLADPYPFIGANRSTGVNYEALYIALNSADTDQAVLKYGKHLLFATKGRFTWREPLNFLMDYFHLVIVRCN